MIYSYGIAPVGYHKDVFVIDAFTPTTGSSLPYYLAFRFLSRVLFVPGIADFTAREIRYAMREAHCEIPLPLSIPSLITVEDPSPL